MIESTRAPVGFLTESYEKYYGVHFKFVTNIDTQVHISNFNSGYEVNDRPYFGRIKYHLRLFALRSGTSTDRIHASLTSM